MRPPSKLRQILATAMLLGFAALPMAGCATSEKSIIPSYVAYPDLQNVGLRQVWEQRADLASNEHVANAWRVNDSVYVATDRGALIRIDAKSGVKTWEVTLNETASQIHRPAETADGKNVVVVNRGNGYIFEKRSGAQLLRNSLQMSIMNDPIVMGNVLALGSMGCYKGIYLDQLAGQIWITVADDDVFMSNPVTVADNIVIASRTGHLWRITMGTGDWDWKDRKTNGEVVAGLAADSHMVYVPSLDNRVYAFDVTSGSQYWETRLEGTLDQQAVPLPGQVLVPSTGKGLYSLTTDMGDIKWVAEGVSEVGTVIGDHVWAGDSGGNLRAVSLADGHTISTTAIPFAQIFVRNPGDDLVIMVNKAGIIAAYAPVK